MSNDGEVHALRAENAAPAGARRAPRVVRRDVLSPADALRHEGDNGAALRATYPRISARESIAAGDSLTGADLERQARCRALPGAAKQAMLADARAPTGRRRSRSPPRHPPARASVVSPSPTPTSSNCPIFTVR